METYPTYKGLIVRKIPWWMKLFIYPMFARGAAFLGRIYLNKSLFQQYCLGSSRPEILGVLEHELTHVERAKKIGKYRFAWRMMTSRSFKFNEEVEARRTQMVVHKKHGIPFDVEFHARKLSSWVYQWCSSYEKAKKVLTNMWEEIQKQP